MALWQTPVDLFKAKGHMLIVKGIVHPPPREENSVNLFTLMSNLYDLISSMEDKNIFLTLYNMVSFVNISIFFNQKLYLLTLDKGIVHPKMKIMG